MNNKIILPSILLFLFTLAFPSCDDEQKITPEWDPSGLYHLKIKVNGRPPAVLESDTANIYYEHTYLYGEIMDTTQNKCCHWKFSRHNCPSEYSIYNFKVFKQKNQYYLSNNIDSSDNRQLSFHIPLQFDGLTLTLTDTLRKDKRSYHLASIHSNMTSTASYWPTWFDLLYFEMSLNAGGLISGQWAIMEKQESCTTTMSNGETKEYFMTEFADVVFTKTGE